jgi:hypothetical protein
MDDLDDRHVALDERRREERDAVLAVDHVVDAAETAQQSQRRARVEAQCAARPHDLDAVDHRARRLLGPAGRQPRHARAGLDPPRGDLVHVLLGTARLGVLDVAPVQHDDPGALELREPGDRAVDPDH